MKVSKFGFEAQLLRWTESSNGGATIVLQLQDADDLAIFKTMTLAKKGTVGQRLAVAIAEIDDQEQLVPHEVKTPVAPPAVGGGLLVAVQPAPTAGDAATVGVFAADMGTHYVGQSPIASDGLPTAAAMVMTPIDKDKHHKAHFPGGFCGLAVQWGDDAQFREWLAMEFQSIWEDTAKQVRLTNKTADVERAALAIKYICAAASRKDLDNEPSRALFEDCIRAPYMSYLKEGE